MLHFFLLTQPNNSSNRLTNKRPSEHLALTYLTDLEPLQKFQILALHFDDRYIPPYFKETVKYNPNAGLTADFLTSLQMVDNKHPFHAIS